MKPYPRWYMVAFLLIELAQALVGVATLAFVRPAWTVSFARWYADFRRSREYIAAIYRN